MNTLTASAAGLATLILAGTLMAGLAGQTYPPSAFQVSVLAVVLSAVSTLVAPISSALGMETWVAPGGVAVRLGLAPLASWVAAGVLIGLMSRKAKNSIPPALFTSSLVYLALIGLSIYVLPRLPGAVEWQTYLSRVSSAIILEGPLDFVFIFAAPLAASLLTSGLRDLYANRPATLPPPRRRRFWEWVEEE
ncbi:MAG: hypothetical protein NZ919_02400 [Candidatus Caldarchaeum sp.]|nr:hypothetical protein [Candidatus Caldarchaeum sp.]